MREKTPAPRIEEAQKLQRRAQWRLDFIAAENSMGFHAPQEAMRVLGEAIDYARQGQVVLLGGSLSSRSMAGQPAASTSAAAPPASASPAVVPR